MNFKKTEMFIKMVVIILFTTIGTTVLADESKEKAENFASFNYKIAYPDNQVGNKQGALVLDMKPGQTQKIPVTLNNSSDHETTLLVKVSGARTNINGLVERGPSRFEADDSMAYDLPDLLTTTAEVVVPAKGEKEITLDFNMPEVAFEGIVLGGVQVTPKDSGEAPADGSMVINKFARLFGVTLRMGKEKVKPELALKKVYAGLQSYVSVIHLDIANETPVLLQDLTTEVEISHKTNQLVSYNSRKNNMEMAPNSILNYYVSLDGEPMMAGDYTVKAKVSNGEHKWEWTEEFTITSEEAAELNKDNMGLVQERRFDWKVVVMGIAAILGGVLLVALVVMVLKKKKVATSSSKKRKRNR